MTFLSLPAESPSRRKRRFVTTRGKTETISACDEASSAEGPHLSFRSELLLASSLVALGNEQKLRTVD